MPSWMTAASRTTGTAVKKFEPCQDVDDAENAIYRQDLTDVVDILKEILKETEGNTRK